MDTSSKHIFRLAGSVLAVMGVVFVLVRVSSYLDEINLRAFNCTTLTVASTLATTYALANLLLAQAWRSLLQHFGITVTVKWAVWAYGVSQIGKYIPGNIFHLAGRQALGSAAGLGHLQLAKSSLWELGLITATGALIGLLALPLVFDNFSNSAGLAIFMVTCGIASIVLRQYLSQPICIAFLLYVSFLLLSGMQFVLLFELFNQTDSFSENIWLPVVGAYVLAWVAGLVVPGAPAGIGVREMMLILLLQHVIDRSEVVIISVVAARIVTSLGDLICFIVASCLQPKQKAFKY